MRVIADLHGGDPDDPDAKAEFREIKDRVMSEVNFSFSEMVLHAELPTA